MKIKKLFFYLLAGILGGCIPVMSLNPLFTEKDIAFDEKLIGTWIDDSNDTWQFSDTNKPEKAYELIFTDEKGQKGSFITHLVKLENKLFLDVFPSQMPWDMEDPNKTQWPYDAYFLTPSHTFIKVNETEPQLKLQLTDDDELKKLLEEDPNAIEHASNKDQQLILTASTGKLQRFVLKYADDSRVFTKESVLTRKKAEEPSSTDPNKN
jgi:hypothetical protein